MTTHTATDQAGALWQRYAPAIMRTLSGYEADPHLREDLAHEVFIAIAQSLPRLQRADNPRAYVFRIAHNVAVDHITRAVRKPAEPHPPDVLGTLQELQGDTPEDPADSVVAAQRQSVLLRAVRSLDTPYRQVIMLMLEDLDTQEIAEILQISPGAVRVRQNRAKTRLKECLRHEQP